MPKAAKELREDVGSTIAVDTSETKPIDPDAYFDIFIRFNDDLEKDYCFQVNTSTIFADLFLIFKSLPLSLRPSVFYEISPVSFKISTSPGYLTSDGALLFDYNAEKVSRPIPGLDEKIADHVLEGQLILPQWEFNYFNFYAFVSALVVWLYTDLPDFISPTPGLALTNQITYFAASVMRSIGNEFLAQKLIDDVNEPVLVLLQCVFFAVHIIKCLLIFAVLYLGMFNPIKVLRFGNKGLKLDVSNEELIQMGWTGSCRATPDSYQEHYRNYKIKEHGGLVSAHQAGVFDVLKKVGCVLKPGEGFDTPKGTSATIDEMIEMKKFFLTPAYIKMNHQAFARFLQEKPELELLNYVKQYRRYGLLHSEDKIKTLVNAIKQRD